MLMGKRRTKGQVQYIVPDGHASGLATVDEAATYLGKSTEQVRRYLRESALSGYHVGNQWVINMKDLEQFRSGQGGGASERLALVERARRLRVRIGSRAGVSFDPTRLMEETRRGR